MPFEIGDHNAYMHERAPRHIERDGRIRDADGKPFQPTMTITVVATGEHQHPPFGSVVDYSEFYRWCDEHCQTWFAWSPFSTKFRNYFSFERAADAVAFKLRFG